jgi:hypothetical protein
MLTFCGFEIELTVDEVQARDDGRRLYCARDCNGHQWLIVNVDDNPNHLAWLCVPVSPQAVELVLSGRASLRDVARHSNTGTVEVVVVHHGHAVPDRCILCSSLPEHLLPNHDRAFRAAA